MMNKKIVALVWMFVGVVVFAGIGYATTYNNDQGSWFDFETQLDQTLLTFVSNQQGVGGVILEDGTHRALIEDRSVISTLEKVKGYAKIVQYERFAENNNIEVNRPR